MTARRVSAWSRSSMSGWVMLTSWRHERMKRGSLTRPSSLCAALCQDSTQPVIVRLATSESLRSGVSAEHPAEQWATAMDEVLTLATRQPSHYNNWWDGADYGPRVASFIASPA